MGFLARTITIVIEIIALLLFIIWYWRSGEIEPLIGIVTTSGVLIVSIITKLTTRPRIVLHHRKTYWGRSPKGYTANNPPIIYVGVDNPEQYWELNWNYDLEIRNNSSLVAYNIQIEYINLPPKTFIEGEIGKIEPVQSHELRNFRIKLIQNVTGTYIEADRYMDENADELTKNFKIFVKYTDESGLRFRTEYNWQSDQNRFLLF